MILKNKLRIYRYKLSFAKFLNLFRRAFFLIKLALSSLKNPGKLFNEFLQFLSYFNKENLVLASKRLNLKAAGFIAIVMILVAGGWMFGNVSNRIEAQTAAGNTATTIASDNSPCDSGVGTWVGCNGDEGWLPAIAQTGVRTIFGITKDSSTEVNGEVVSQREDGVLDVVAGLWVETYNKPVSGTLYIEDSLEKINLVPKAYAQQQKTGVDSLRPILPLWETTRDITLSFIAAIIVLIGFLVLIGARMGGAMITITSALPRVLIVVVLILFSYPIVGLMLDFAEVGNSFITTTFLGDLTVDGAGVTNIRPITNGSTDPLSIQGNSYLYYDKLDSTKGAVNIFSLMQQLNRTDEIKNSVSDIIDEILNSVNSGGNAISATGSKLVSYVVQFIFGLALLGAIFKTFFGLLSAFVGIVLKTIIAPIQLLIIAVPSSGASVSAWLKGLLADILVFPATYALLVIAAVIMGDVLQAPIAPIWQIEHNLVSSPDAQFGAFPLPLGNFQGTTTSNSGITLNIFSAFIAFGILLFLPSIPGLIKNALKTTDITAGATQQVGGSLKGVASKIPIVGGFVR